MLQWLKGLMGDKPAPDDPLGPRGENAAAKHLRGLGYRILTRNFRTDLGEIDIIARDGRTLVFVEVKTRVSDDDVPPEQQVDAHKQQQVVRVAKLFLGRYGTPQPEYRFDIVAIVWPTGRQPQIRHLTSAFTG